MKHNFRKLMSVVMTLAIICSMIPAALAVDAPANMDWDGTWTKHADHELCEGDHTPGTGTVVTAATCTAAGTATQTCTTCHGTQTGTIAALGHAPAAAWTTDGTNHWHACTNPGCTVKLDEHAHTEAVGAYISDSTGHWHKCSDCQAKMGEVAAHTPATTVTAGATTHYYVCSACGYKVNETAHAAGPDATYTNLTPATHTFACATCAASVTEEHTWSSRGICTACGYENKNAIAAVTINSSAFTLAPGAAKNLDYTCYSDSGKTTVTGFTPSTAVWTSSDEDVVTINAAGKAVAEDYGTAVLTLTINGTITDTVTVTVKATADIDVTVSQSLETYYFTSDATATGYGVYDLIIEELNRTASYYYTVDPSDYYITLSGAATTVGSLYKPSGLLTLSDLDEVYLTLSRPGTWSGTYSVTDRTTGTEALSGTITIEVTEYTGIDILYTGELGEDVLLDVADFEEFWSEYTSARGELSYVKINSVTGNGTLCYEHTASEKRHTSAVNNNFYVSPTRASDKYLSDLTFVPSMVSKKYVAQTVTIGFTAYGTTRAGGTSLSSNSGVVTIIYTDGKVEAIDYAMDTTGVNLDVDDFNAVYLKALDLNSRSYSYTVKFLDVPTYGTMYVNYGVNNRGQITGTELKKNNIDAYSFTCRSSGTSTIEDVTYLPGRTATAETIRYAVYSGTTLKYVGEINFGAVKTVSQQIKYHSTGSAVTFNAMDFYNAVGDYTYYVKFGTPSAGTLYKNYTGKTGTMVTGSDSFAISAATNSIASVTFVPPAGYNGVLTIPYTAGSVLGTGKTTSGVVYIYVISKSFTDVKPGVWYENYVTELAASGIVKGMTTTTFGPSSNVTYGQALKLIMLAAGYPAQPEPAGSNWASNYLTAAYSAGLVSSRYIDLNKAITRLEIAEIAAKALKLNPATTSTSANAPYDTTNGYVLALYNAGIVEGSNVGGRNYYYGSNSIIRSEICAIICRINDYAK